MDESIVLLQRGSRRCRETVGSSLPNLGIMDPS